MVGACPSVPALSDAIEQAEKHVGNGTVAVQAAYHREWRGDWWRVIIYAPPKLPIRRLRQVVMTISSLAGSAAPAASQTNATTRARQGRVPADAAPQGTRASGESAGFSQVGELLSTLEGLAASDPKTFKATTARLSTMLASAAQATDGAEADWLSSMARRFETAAATGALPSVESRGIASAPPTYSPTGLLTPSPTFRPELPAVWAEIFNA